VNGPTGARQVARLPSAAHFDHRNAIPFLRQPKRRNAAAKAGSDDDQVKIELAVVGRHRNATVLKPGLAQIRATSNREKRYLRQVLRFPISARTCGEPGLRSVRRAIKKIGCNLEMNQ